MRPAPTLVAYCALTLLVLLRLADWADPPPAAGSDCRISYVIDGDTVVLSCPEGRRRARLTGIDTPEMSGGCPEESAGARRARAALQGMIAQAQSVSVEIRGADRYGRALVKVALDGKDAGAALVLAGHARPYDGGARAGWCG